MRAIRLPHVAFLRIFALIDFLMEPPHEGFVFFVGGFCIQIVRKTKRAEHFAKLFVICFTDLGWSFVFLRRADHDGRSVAIAARNVEHARAFGSVVPGNYVARKQRSDVADVQRAVCVRPRAADDDVFHFFYLISLWFDNTNQCWFTQ